MYCKRLLDKIQQIKKGIKNKKGRIDIQSKFKKVKLEESVTISGKSN